MSTKTKAKPAAAKAKEGTPAADKAAKTEPAAKKQAPEKKDKRTATIRALVTPVKVPAGTLARGGEARKVPMAHAEYLAEKGQAEIIEVTE